MSACPATPVLSVASEADSEMSPPRSPAASLPLLLSIGSNWSLAARIVAIASTDCDPACVVTSTRAL